MNKIHEVNRILGLRIQPAVLTDKDLGNHFILVQQQIDLYNPAIPYTGRVIRGVYMGKRTNGFNMTFILFKNMDTSEIIFYPANKEIKDIFREKDIDRSFKHFSF